MKFTCLRENLIMGISTTGHITLKTNSLPVLNNLFIEVKNNQLNLISTNLEVGIKHTVRGKAEKEGECLVSAKLLLELIPLLPEGQITLEITKEGLNITTKKAKTILRVIPVTEFPIIPSLEETNDKIILSAHILKTLFQQSVFAVGRIEQRPQFNGVLFGVDQGKLIATATDSYRLVENTYSLEEPKINIPKVIIPTITVQEVIRTVGFYDDNETIITIGENQIKFLVGSTEITSRLIDGEYPEYEPLFPGSKEGNRYSVDVSILSKAIKATTLFSRAGLSDVSFAVKDNILEVFSKNGELGSHKTEVPIEGDKQNHDFSIVLNARYFLDGLGTIGDNKVNLKLVNKDRPVLLQPHKKTEIGFRYLVMPIRQ